MDDKLYWLWLQECIGAGYPVKEVFNYFKDAKGVYEAEQNELYESGLFLYKSSVSAGKIFTKMKTTDIKSFQKTLDICQEHDIYVLTPNDENYPKSLLEISNYPCVLFARGDICCLNNERIFAVVGTRKPSEYGEQSAKLIVKGLAENNATIISGGALGVDSIAHQGAIDVGAKTILVMGCGHGTNYLMVNSPLRKAVSQNGVLISEYPPFTKVDKSTFPLRNRLISGMSLGLVIIEAASKSGTLNTARHAKAQNKDIFVLPGDIKSENYRGSNNLIVTGANAIFSADDIMNFYRLQTQVNAKIQSEYKEPFEGIDIIKKPAKTKRKKPNLSKQTKKCDTPVKSENKEEINLECVSSNGKLVYNVIVSGVCELDEITRNLELPINKVLACLTELELLGIIVSRGANKYELK